MVVATIIELTGQPKGCPKSFKCYDSVAIPKGTLLTLSGAGVDEVVVSSDSVGPKPAAGIAAEEKVAGDGATQIGVWTKGKFDITTTATVMGPGEIVCISGANLIAPASSVNILSGAKLGKLLEPGTASGVHAVAVDCYGG